MKSGWNFNLISSWNQVEISTWFQVATWNQLEFSSWFQVDMHVILLVFYSRIEYSFINVYVVMCIHIHFDRTLHKYTCIHNLEINLKIQCDFKLQTATWNQLEISRCFQVCKTMNIQSYFYVFNTYEFTYCNFTLMSIWNQLEISSWFQIDIRVMIQFCFCHWTNVHNFVRCHAYTCTY